MRYKGSVEEKEKELSETIRKNIFPFVPNKNQQQQASKEIINYFFTITPPEFETAGLEKSKWYYITINESGKGISRKPGNILLNWKKILTVAPTFPLTLHNITIPWLAPFAILVVLAQLLSLTGIKIGKRQAAVIWTMWNNKDEENCIENNKMLSLVNKELSKHKEHTMNKEELKRMLKDLEKLGCIKRKDENRWRLREKVKIKYK